MLACSIVLSLVLHLAQGSRLGSPKNDDKSTGWAWKDGEHRAPPGQKHLAASKEFEHAWAGKEDAPSPEVMDEVPAAAGVPRKVIHANEDTPSLEPAHVAKYDADSELKISARQSTDLQGTLANDAEDSMNLEEFMPKCLKHTKSLITDLDYNYGDAQLETVLRNWCQSAKEFPLTRGTRKAIGYKNHQSCTDFADDLKNARFAELKTTSDKGYRKFCKDFYAHHGGLDALPQPPRKEKPARSGTSWVGLSMVVLGLMLCVA